MSVWAYFFIIMILAVLIIVLAVVLGDYGPWYFSWLLGTGFMILVAAMGGVLYEGQAEAEDKLERDKQA